MDYFLQSRRPAARQTVTLRRCTPAEHRRCSRCKTKCAPPCRTRSSSCRTRWKTSRRYVRNDPVHRRMAGQPPWRVSHRALLRAQRTQLRGLHGCAAHRVGALGQCGQRHRPRRLSRQRPATAHAGSSAAAFPEKITHIGATVSPQNQYSLHNALASGFAIVSRREMYGGHDRYLLAKAL